MPQILSIGTTVRRACTTGDLSTAEQLLTQQINADPDDDISYANRSFVMARKHQWDQALQDAIKSLCIRPSLTGYISKGIALSGKGHVQDSVEAFDLAFTFANEDSRIIHFLHLIKVMTVFNVDEHEEAPIRIRERAAACPNDDTLAYMVVEAYLYVRLGNKATDDARYNEAADHFTAAVNTSASSSMTAIHYIYEDLVVLFGWNMKSLWMAASQKRCHALLLAGRLRESAESHRYVMDTSDETTKNSCLEWSTAFKQECRTICATNGDAALAESDYDRAIDLYSTVIDMDPTSDALFSNRSKAKLGKMLWKEALLDAQKVIELNPSSYLGYDLKHAALHGAKRYDEAIQAFQTMLSKLGNAHDTQTLKLRQQYIRPCEAERAIREVIDAQIDTAPLRVLNTATGLLCDRGALISDFTTSTEYKELWSSTTTHADLSTKRIEEVVATYFSYAMLSHRWGGKEPLLQDIQRKVVYDLEPVDGITKLQSFCGIARSAGYRWAWSDTCCIDQNNNVELQRSVNSMFLWYRHSSLTVVYLSDVTPLSQSGALANSVWNTRGWTFQEFLASKVILFYQKDWMLYLDDRSHNHKECAAIMQELQDATGIDRQTLVSFRPGMSGARDRLQWASTRITTLPEDVAYSLFGIFGVHLPVIYGEKKENALGRLLQEIVGRSGDITVLDWVGQSSEFNSCLPADITSYAASPRTMPSLSEDEIQTAVSSLRNAMPMDAASKFYDRLEQLSPPRFTNCRLHLPCITFHVTEVRRRRGPAQGTPFTYGVKANGLRDLLITTEETLVQFSRAKPTRQTFLLVRPWNHCLLELPDFSETVPAIGDDAESIGDWSEPESPLDDSDESPDGSPGEEELGDSDSYSRAL
ncbi:uncharacterized protein EDB91DRAFT_589691 [Suillus paluster]|uniref:uncharacterized protein n=1 Tax=Suillus paluster TaxID=48578 RepID=UPI001B868B6A|nr:uncharacterized protein EDB91DRAFT_589691 [Suillus paluster]KAG1734460.1 hypothetical protein EDB91DRAFT_589691 [Suillus paluster]